MKKIWTILPALVAFGATPALAQDATVGGPRVELRVGHDEIHAELEIRNQAYTDQGSANGIGYGAEAGFDYPVTPSFLVGAYVGVDLSDVGECGHVFTNVAIFANDELCIKAGQNLTVGARAGLPLSEGSLLYVKAGLSRARLKASFAENVDIASSQLFSDSDTVGGYHLGAGFELGLGEVGLGDNFYVKGEYVHSRYKNAFKSELPTGSTFNPTRHQIMAGFGVRF